MRTPRSEPPEDVRRGALGVYLRLLGEARGHYRHMAALILASLLATPIALLWPVPLKIVLDNVIGSQPAPLIGSLIPGPGAPSEQAVLMFAVLLLVAVALVNELVYLGTAMLGAWLGQRVRLRFRARLFGHVQRLSLAYHDTTGAADSLYRIQNDTWPVEHVNVYGVAPFLSAGLTLIGTVYVTARLDWQLALVALLVCPLLFLAALTSHYRLRAEWTETERRESSALAVVSEVLNNLRVVKAFGQEDREQERFVQRSRETVRASLRFTLLQRGFAMLIGGSLGIGSAAVLCVGALHVRAGRLTTGELVLVMAYLAQIYNPLKTLAETIGHIQSSIASARRAYAVLDAPLEVCERPDARPLARAAGGVAFHRVRFGYSEDRAVLDDITFEIRPGTRVGIVGSTGEGKTTLISLLVRFYDPTAGTISLDGVDLRDYRLADLRNQFAVVLQEPVLFSASIAENIAYGRPGATHDEIVAAARAANAHDFIDALPDGYGTGVGERGMMLSGGERQRVALARAFLKDAPILVLDEPTSSVDARTEAAIVDAMDRLMEGRTTFFISHRLSALSVCDLQLVVTGGRAHLARAEVDLTGDAGRWTAGVPRRKDTVEFGASGGNNGER